MVVDEEPKFSPEEIENSKRIFKSATPKYTLDWYVKWAASIIILCSLAMRAAGPEYRLFDIYLGWIGIGLWIWVSVVWQDRALIMLNVVSWFMLTVAILREW
jgi:hypothetical protein